MLLEGENINLHGTPLNRLSPANQSRSRHGPSHLSVQGTRRRLPSAWAGATISVPGNSSRRKRRRETERRKIMYNTNKVSLSPPTPFIPNQFLVKEPNPEGLSARGRCTGEKAGYKMHSSKQRQKPSSAYQSLGKAHTQHLCCWQLHRSQFAPSRAGVPLLWSWGGTLTVTALLGTPEESTRELHQPALGGDAKPLHANSISVGVVWLFFLLPLDAAITIEGSPGSGMK